MTHTGLPRVTLMEKKTPERASEKMPQIAPRESRRASTPSFQGRLNPTLELQRTTGNRALAGLLQAKLAMSGPGGSSERNIFLRQGEGGLTEERSPSGGGSERVRVSAPADAMRTAHPPPATLPTRPQLNAEVDRIFREFFPNAPKRLDPNDPTQADLVDTWLGIRDGILDQWTDIIFFSFFPNAPKKLDPSKPDDAQLIEFWGDIPSSDPRRCARQIG